MQPSGIRGVEPWCQHPNRTSQLVCCFDQQYEQHEFSNQEFDGKAPTVLGTAIEDLDFSVRTYNCLKRAGINSIGDLVARQKRT